MVYVASPERFARARLPGHVCCVPRVLCRMLRAAHAASYAVRRACCVPRMLCAVCGRGLVAEDGRMAELTERSGVGSGGL